VNIYIVHYHFEEISSALISRYGIKMSEKQLGICWHQRKREQFWLAPRECIVTIVINEIAMQTSSEPLVG